MPMRTREEVKRVQALARSGLNKCEISRATGIPRSTLRNWLDGQLPDFSRAEPPVLDDLPARAYSYLFGLYLGDGWIAQHPRGVYRLGIALDSRYPRLIAGCVTAVRKVMPDNRVTVQKHPVHNVVRVHSYSKHWPTLLPQHGRYNVAVSRRADVALLDTFIGAKA